MSTVNIGRFILEGLLDGAKTASEIENLLRRNNGIDLSRRKISRIIARLEEHGFVKTSENSETVLYELTALGQAVTEKPKK